MFREGISTESSEGERTRKDCGQESMGREAGQKLWNMWVNRYVERYGARMMEGDGDRKWTGLAE